MSGIAAALALPLAGFAAMAAAPSEPPPDRDAIAAALLGWMACEGHDDCPPPRRRAVVASWRCRGDDDGLAGPPRWLCRFSGHYRLAGGGRADFPADCAWFWRPDGIWAVQAVPDHDLCDV